MQEVTNGTSIEELWARLTKKEDKHEKVPTTSFDKKIPKDLVQIQAYIRWEKAGKPNYSQDEQLVRLVVYHIYCFEASQSMLRF